MNKGKKNSAYATIAFIVLLVPTVIFATRSSEPTPQLPSFSSPTQVGAKTSSAVDTGSVETTQLVSLR